ncbi:vWA domain-containing protein [Deinococcus ficus]|uniref:VWA domain-containing protein n=1 Tax=Deinococcus ficus TaxID=317577 RepID=A0A221T3E7_9DEIO|nr:vWA domain-containing protein [Deinococcus ficus]ASN83437.1 VWA domain-containing protein [Deinococcus ficus]
MYLHSVALPTPAASLPGHKHVLLLIDVSCSMTSELPGLTADLHRHLLEHLCPGDELSVVWFSGRGECGAVLAHETVTTLAESQRVADLIGRWLVPVGSTRFTDALNHGAALAARPTSAVFMTDGQDTQNDRSSILQAAQELALHVRDAHGVEYGDHTDRRTLSELAGMLGAAPRLVQSAAVDQDVTGQVLGLPAPAEKTAFDVLRDDPVIIVQAEAGQVMLPEGTAQVRPFTGLPGPDDVGGKPEGAFQDALYVQLLRAARTLDGPEIERTLRRLGDRALIQLTGGLYGKQRFGQFEAVVEEMCTRPERRYPLGYDAAALPDESQPTVTEVLTLLSDGGSELLTRHPAFQYRRVSRGTAPDPDPAVTWRGTGEPRITGLVSHARRPNLSLQVTTPGTAQLRRPPQALAALLPDTLDVPRVQTYTVLHSGILHLSTLPVRPSPVALTQLKAWGLAPEHTAPGEAVCVELGRLPLVRRSEVQRVRAADFARRTVQLERHKAVVKVLREAYAVHFPPRSSAMLAGTYGADAAAWLREQGVTDRGFSPRGPLQPGRDDVPVVELEVAIKGVSSLPKTSDVLARIAAGKALTTRERLIQAALAQVPVDPAELPGALDRHLQHVREAEVDLRRDLMALLVGQTWFADLAPDETEVTVTEGGEPFTVRLGTRELTEGV